MNVDIVARRIERLRVHLARDGKRRDFKAWELLGRLLSWRQSPDALRQDTFNLILREMYSPDHFAETANTGATLFALVRKAS